MTQPWFERLAEHCKRKGRYRPIYDRVIENLYLERFYLHPRWLTLGLFRVVLHHFCRSDSPLDGLHCHPWPYITIILSGGYWEHTEHGCRFYKAGRILVRRSTHRHRVELTHSGTPVWTLFIMGPRVREWGFWIKGPGNGPRRFYPWREWIEIRKRGAGKEAA